MKGDQCFLKVFQSKLQDLFKFIPNETKPKFCDVELDPADSLFNEIRTPFQDLSQNPDLKAKICNILAKKYLFFLEDTILSLKDETQIEKFADFLVMSTLIMFIVDTFRNNTIQTLISKEEITSPEEEEDFLFLQLTNLLFLDPPLSHEAFNLQVIFNLQKIIFRNKEDNKKNKKKNIVTLQKVLTKNFWQKVKNWLESCSQKNKTSFSRADLILGTIYEETKGGEAFSTSTSSTVDDENAEIEQKQTEQSFYYYQRAANSGNAEAQYKFALFLEQGRGCAQDIASSIQFFEKSANQSHCPACVKLADIFFEDPTSRDVAKAALYLEKAALLGEVSSQHKLGSILLSQQDFEKSEQFFTMAASSGHTDSMVQLGFIYETAKQNIETAMKWYEKAAALDNPSAMNNLGTMHETGFVDVATGKPIVPKNLFKAAEYYTKAADQQLPEGLFNLGRCYKLGLGVAKSVGKAIELFEDAALGGHQLAPFCCGDMLADDPNEEKQEIARFWMERAADNGIVEAQEWIRKNPAPNAK